MEQAVAPLNKKVETPRDRLPCRAYLLAVGLQQEMPFAGHYQLGLRGMESRDEEGGNSSQGFELRNESVVPAGAIRQLWPRQSTR